MKNRRPARAWLSYAGVKIIAHRGASQEAPENTIPAIHLAWQEKADGVEIDVRLTSDGKVVLMHDASTARTAGVNLEVGAQIWDALRNLDVGKWKSPRFRMTTIPLFRDVLKMLPSSRELWVEIKCGSEILPALNKDLDVCRPAPASLCLLGFSAHLMGDVKKHFPMYRAFWNVEARGKTGAPSPWLADRLIEQARKYGLNGLSVGLSDAVDEGFIQQVHAAGLELVVWVVDDEHAALRLAHAGLKALMTNKPAFIRHRLRDHGIH